MVLCISVKYFFKWGSVVFEFYVPPFWSQSFRFAQTDGTRTGYSYSVPGSRLSSIFKLLYFYNLAPQITPSYYNTKTCTGYIG